MIRNINYNLLKVLDALLTEVHVTRAGEKVFLTQAATSNALNQLRAVFKDPLLVRGQGSKMYLTPFAKSLKPRVQVAMQQFQEVFDLNYRFIPSQAEQTFYVGMSDYIESVLLSKVMVLFYKEAPLAKLVIHHLNYMEDEVLLEQGELDLALGNFPTASDKLKKMPLFKDHAVFFAGKRHPLFLKKTIPFTELLEHPIVMVDYADVSKTNYLDHLLKESRYSPRVNITVPHAYIALETLLHSDLITHSAMKLAKPFIDSKKISVIESIKNLPKRFQQNTIQVYQYWHKNVEENKANIWLRSVFERGAKTI